MTCSSANAFRTLTTEGYTDPDYKDYQVKKVVLLVDNAPADDRAQVETRLSAEFKKRGIELIAYRSLFPPTRTWSPEEKPRFPSASVDSALILTPVQLHQPHPAATKASGLPRQAEALRTGASAALLAQRLRTPPYNIYMLSQGCVRGFVDISLHAQSAQTSPPKVWDRFVSSTGDMKVGEGVVDGLERQSRPRSDQRSVQTAVASRDFLQFA
jgi:hypothetical protein